MRPRHIHAASRAAAAALAGLLASGCASNIARLAKAAEQGNTYCKNISSL